MNEKHLTGTVPVNKEHITGTVPVNKEHLTDTVPVNNKHLTGTLKKLGFSKKYPNTLEVPLSAAPKVPEFCPEVEGNPEP